MHDWFSKNIISRSTRSNYDDNYYLTISRKDLKLYQKEIGFNHPQK